MLAVAHILLIIEGRHAPSGRRNESRNWRMNMSTKRQERTTPKNPQAAAGESDSKELARIAEKMGEVPIPLQLMALRPGTVRVFGAYRDQVLEGGPLGTKERALIQLTAAVAMRLTSCVRKLTAGAKKAGASQAEIVQAMLIAGLQSGTSMLRTAYEGFAPVCRCGNCHPVEPAGK
jgi:alkylhydroperoxidase/carboxymuconolactone decarboxylase family protein YurZ